MYIYKRKRTYRSRVVPVVVLINWMKWHEMKWNESADSPSCAFCTSRSCIMHASELQTTHNKHMPLFLTFSLSFWAANYIWWTGICRKKKTIYGGGGGLRSTFCVFLSLLHYYRIIYSPCLFLSVLQRTPFIHIIGTQMNHLNSISIL